MIDKATAEKIKNAADIVEVVSDYVHLIRRGQNFMGLCPFHNERTPSFSVNRRRNFCYCFSCHKGGSPVNFIMEKEGLNYEEALRWLARKYGIKIVERELDDEERRRLSERESMMVANEWAMHQMQENLTETEEGRNVGLEYFRHRGVTDEALKAFRLGYSTDQGQWLVKKASREGYDLHVLRKVGLIGTSQDGRDYDRFRGRVIYPILNPAGKTVAFGGRDIKGSSPAKYVNSPESEIYRKSNELYGIFQAKGAIVKQDLCYLVEGYMDVIGMWQSGLQNVVASSGTALTDGQIAMIHRFTDKVTLIYDGDSAGIKASLRGIEMLLSHKMQVNVLLLPDGHDPDSFARENIPEAFRRYVEEHAEDVVSFMTRILVPKDNSDPQRRSSAIRTIIKALACIHDNITRNQFAQKCSLLLNVPEDLILREIARERRELVAGWKREKEKENLGNPSLSGETSHPSESQQSSASQDITGIDRQKQGVSILIPAEREVLRYAVRYGMLYFCQGVDEDGNVLDLSVIDYIEEELQADDISFSEPLYGRAFNMVAAMRGDFIKAYGDFCNSIESEIGARRRIGYDDIAEKNLDVASIERAEAELEEKLEAEKNSMIMEFITDYPARILESSEDDEVRKLVTELTAEKYQLSKYHYKSGTVESESDKLDRLVPRAINEWKNALVRVRLDEAIAELKKANDCGDTQQVLAMQKHIAELTAILREISQSIGERIISPKWR